MRKDGKKGCFKTKASFRSLKKFLVKARGLYLLRELQQTHQVLCWGAGAAKLFFQELAWVLSIGMSLLGPAGAVHCEFQVGAGQQGEVSRWSLSLWPLLFLSVPHHGSCVGAGVLMGPHPSPALPAPAPCVRWFLSSLPVQMYLISRVSSPQGFASPSLEN